MTDNSKRAPNILMYAPSLLKALERVALAPARGYLAQSPQANFGGGWLGNALTQAHKAIDPVNAMGGYGGLLAMALPPGTAKMPVKMFDWTPGGGTKFAKVGNTEITYGVDKDGTAELTLVKTPSAKRGQGSAKEAVNQFLQEADEHGLRVQLNADPMDAKTSKPRLEKWYESLGFKRNAGRNKD